VAVWIHFARGLPEPPTVEGYRPPIITELVSADGQIAAEFFSERRKVVPYQRIPRRVIQAFVASEDQRFFEHGGVDWRGTARAAFTTYLLRHGVKGGSSITQQTAKSILISAEGFQEGTRRNLRRKVRELILATRLERTLTKQQILWLYLNGVYLGHHSYGVQAAAENYFRKNVEDLTLEEAALLAGLPQAPSRYSPFAHPESAKDRRRYVLRRMAEEGFIDAAERSRAEAAEVKVFGVDDVFRETAPFYAEQVRRQVVERYGNERLLDDGLRVELAMDLEKQRLAQAAMLKGLMEVDHRQGFYGPVAQVEGAARQELEARLARTWPAGSLEVGDYAVGIVTQVDEAAASVQVGRQAGLLPVAGLRWARKPNPEAWYPDALVTRASSVLRPGDVVLVRRVEPRELSKPRPTRAQAGKKPAEEVEVPEPPEGGVLLALEQEPKLQGALVSTDPVSGMAVAMVGGYDFDASEFNRAFQACRQPGSAFKPLVYAAALERLDWTPATILTDAPLVFRDEDEAWKPKNYGEDFKGDVTLRTALVNSMNIPAVKTAEALTAKLGQGFLGEWARQLGLTTAVKKELGTALGSSCVSLWELTGVYATFARYGDRRPQVMVRRVLDREGRTLEDHSEPRDAWVPLATRLGAAAAEVARPRVRAVDERSAYQLVHLLREAATVGTGAQAAKLGKPAAGKTGTTNDSFDTWFMGFTRDLATGVWLGYDANLTPLSRYETGGRAALPVWLDYMSGALRDRPQPEFMPPAGIVEVRIDPATGKPVAEGQPGVLEPFRTGTEPREAEEGAPPQAVEVQDLFLH
jgi:penicillin-binding protein 1A